MNKDDLPCKDHMNKLTLLREQKKSNMAAWSVGKYQKTYIQCDQNLFKNFDNAIPFKTMKKGRFEIRPIFAVFSDNDSLLHVLYRFDIPVFKKQDCPIGFREMVKESFTMQKVVTVNTQILQIIECDESKLNWSDEFKLFCTKEDFLSTVPFSTLFFETKDIKNFQSIASSSAKRPRVTAGYMIKDDTTSKKTNHIVYIDEGIDTFDLEIPKDKRVGYMAFNKGATVLALILDCGQVIFVKPLQRHVPGNYAKDIFFRFQ